MSKQANIFSYFPKRKFTYSFGNSTDMPRGRTRLRIGSSRSRTRTRTRRRGSRRGGGVTSQLDRKVLYVRRRAPYAVRRRAKRRMRMFKRNLMQLSGRKNCVISSKTQLNWGPTGWAKGFTNNEHASLVCIHMCGGSGTAPNAAGTPFGSEFGTKDLDNVAALNASSDEKTERLYIRNWNLDFTVTNDNGYPMEYDVYEVSYRMGTYTKGATSFLDLAYFIGLQYIVKDDLAAATELFVNDWGFGYRYMDPIGFAVLAKMGVIVTKRTKYVLQTSETFTYQSKGYGGAYTVSENNGGYINRLTKSFLIVGKAVVGYSPSSACTMTVGMSRYYNYYNLPTNQRLNGSHLFLAT